MSSFFDQHLHFTFVSLLPPIVAACVGRSRPGALIVELGRSDD